MHRDLIEFRTGGEVLLIGRVGSLGGAPQALRGGSNPAAALRRVAADPGAVVQLRHFWSGQSLSHPATVHSSDVLLRQVETALRAGTLQAVVLADHGRRPADDGTRGRPQAGRVSAARGRKPPPPPTRTAATALAQAAPEGLTPAAIRHMLMSDRLLAVGAKAAGRLPRAAGEELLAMLTPESVAMAAALAAVGAAANLTPYGWAADAILASIAFGFGGLAAIHGLVDLVACFRQTVAARSEADLDRAADALARAAVALGTLGLMAVLHQKAKKWGGGKGESDTPPPPDLERAHTARRYDEPAPRRRLRPRDEATGRDAVTDAPEDDDARPFDKTDPSKAAPLSLADAMGKETARRWTEKGRANAARNGVDTSHLSDDEIGALYGYTTDDGYRAINPALRGRTQLTPELDAFHRHATAALDKLEPFSGVSYRGENMPAEVLDQHQVGNEVTDAAFKSTTTATTIPPGFSRKVVSEISGESGRDISFLSEFPKEAEVLFKPGTKFTVTERTLLPDGTVRLKMTEAPND